VKTLVFLCYFRHAGTPAEPSVHQLPAECPTEIEAAPVADPSATVPKLTAGVTVPSVAARAAGGAAAAVGATEAAAARTAARSA